MKLFITGATGFLGTHLFKRLAQTEHHLYCLVRENSNVRELEQVATLIRGDVTDKDSLLQGMKGCEGVIHLAAVYSFWAPNKQIYRDVNINGTRYVMESALETGVSKVLHVSTAGVWGNTPDSPFTEDSLVGPIRFGAYFQSKYDADLIVWELFEKKGLPLVVIYPAVVLGPGDPKASGQLIMNLIRGRLPATVFNESVLPFVHVRDVAETIVRALEKKDDIGEKYLVGKFHLTLREFNELVSEISGVPPPKLTLPNSAGMISAMLLTGLADLIKKPPLWGMSTDLMRLLKAGGKLDGSKVQRELGITYTPIRVALEEAIASYHKANY